MNLQVSRSAIAITSICFFLAFSYCYYYSWSGQELFSLSKTSVGLMNLKAKLENASMPNKDVIITTVNSAWARQDSLLDLFLESFIQGSGTRTLLNNLLIVALDDESFSRCMQIHPHCYRLKFGGADFSGEKVFMTKGYLDMMWARVLFLKDVLSLGYNFVFTDVDVLWFRNPFKRFSRKAQFQIACDSYGGDHWNMKKNIANGGFVYVVSSKKTVKFYEWWYKSRYKYPGLHDQDVLNKITKNRRKMGSIGMKIYFLDTKYFSGFCQRRAKVEEVYTMHANCCKGLNAKINDLTLILEDWNARNTTSPSQKFMHGSRSMSWRAPLACKHSW